MQSAERLKGLLVDSHCHLDRLDLAPFGGEFAELMARTREGGVGHIVCVSINLEQYPAMVRLVEGFDEVSITVGVHPNEQDGQDPGADELAALAAHPKNVAIGETGLDYFRSEGETQWQRERFRRHIAAARRVGKPLVIHTRAAAEDTIQILREEQAQDAGGVMHCFAEDWTTAKAALDLGFYISFSGILTFNSAKTLREVAARVPLERILVETDAPYLAPVPHRGKPNLPGYVRHVADKLAEVRGEPLERIIEATTENCRRLFGLPL